MYKIQMTKGIWRIAQLQELPVAFVPGSNPDILSNSVYNNYIQYTQELGCPCTKQKTINKYKKLILSRLKNA